jgi:hypothetical protein
MHVTIRNNGIVDVPVVPWLGNEPAAEAGILGGGDEITIDSAMVDRVDIGEVPGLLDDLKAAAAQASVVLKKAIGALIDRFTPDTKSPEGQSELPLPQKPTAEAEIVLQVTNLGTKPIRVLAGSNLDELGIGPGEGAEVTAPGDTPGSAAWVQVRS